MSTVHCPRCSVVILYYSLEPVFYILYCLNVLGEVSNSKAGAATMQEMIRGTKQLKNEANCSGQQIGELQET